MGNGYHHHHHLHHHSFYSRNSFFPILCRVSIKDVKLKDFKGRSSSFSDEPSSPKVSCIGQVKRNSKVIGFPAPYRLTSSSSTSAAAITTSRNSSTHGNNLKYTKLKRFFSGRNLLSSNTTSTGITTTTNAATAAAATTTNRGIIRRNGSKRSSKINHDDGNNNSHNVQAEVNISELDPPLPVVKKVQSPSEVNLWKRRSGGMTLKSLQIEQIHHQLPNNNFLPAPTV